MKSAPQRGCGSGIAVSLMERICFRSSVVAVKIIFLLNLWWSWSDVLALQMPLADFNVGIINKENIAKMKDGVIILNNSRGQMVVEQDLADALNSGKVAFAGLDVVSTEPIRADNPLLTAKNCIITPHMSWGSQGSRQRIMDCTVNNIRAFLSGAPENVVNP